MPHDDAFGRCSDGQSPRRASCRRTLDQDLLGESVAAVVLLCVLDTQASGPDHSSSAVEQDISSGSLTLHETIGHTIDAPAWTQLCK